MTAANPLVEERHGAIDMFTWLPRIALAIVFVAVGAQKFAEHSVYVRIFDQIGLGLWFRYLTGVMQIGGAVLLLVPGTAAIGFILLGCTMAGACGYWIFTHNAFGAMIPGALLLVITGFGRTEVVRFVAKVRT